MLDKRGIEKEKLLYLILFALIAVVILYIWFKVLLPNLLPK